ncbi:MAG: hypothetical protein Kow00121_52990 [Elainellaceae cyanobacterium]
MAKNQAIVIGINQYRFLQPLKYARRDAEAISEFLVNAAGFDRIFLFTDDSPEIGGKPTEPFRANLLRVLRQIFAQPFMKDGDNFWFFFSGHGIRQHEQDYLMPLDGDPEDVENTGIPTNVITNYLRSCGADNVVLILDACRSGGKKSGEGIGRQTEEEARQTGVISIFSCSPDQYSYEIEAIEQGAFTHALLEGLSIRGRCATVERLNQYLQSQVSQLVQQHLGSVRQTPYTIAEPIDRAHLILMPQHASLADISTLKNDAYRAQVKQDWKLAQRLWIRVLAAAAGQDMEAIEALQTIALYRQTAPPPPQSETAPNVLAPSQIITSPATTPEPPVGKSSPLPLSIQSLAAGSYFPTPAAVGLKRLTRRRFLKWAVPGGIGVVGVTIASQLLGNSSRPTSSSDSSEAISTPEFIPTADSASEQSDSDSDTGWSSRSLDYSKLEEFLEAGQWQEANRETTSLLLQAANQDKWLHDNSIQNISCDVLVQIDQLWVQNSDGQFGFSAQQKIYLEDCGGKLDEQWPSDEQAWQCLGDAVGWRVNGNWIEHSNVIFNTSAPIGHLPALSADTAAEWSWWLEWGISGLLLFQRLASCNI